MGKDDIDPLREEKKASCPTEPMVALEKPFVDARAAIQPLVDEMMKSAVMITSKKSSLRANHYHKTDWHYCYVISGSIEYYHRPTGSGEEPECLIVKTGEIVFAPPMIDHGTKFPKDTTFLTLSLNPRDQASYEADVLRVDMFDTEGLTTWTPGEE